MADRHRGTVAVRLAAGAPCAWCASDARPAALAAAASLRRLARSLARGLALCWLFAGIANGQAALTETGVKAAYLYKFPAYVEWPDGALPADAPLVIGVNGADAVLGELQALLAGRRVGGHPLQARAVADNDSGDGLHVLFVGRAAGLASWTERLRGRPVLLVGDGAGALDAGGMLVLLPVDGRIRFEAAPSAAERAGLRLSARLLALADKVAAR